jgi:hypothetical protein
MFYIYIVNISWFISNRREEMKGRILIVLFFIALQIPVNAFSFNSVAPKDQIDEISAVMALLGLDSEEEIGEAMLEHYSSYIVHPLELNLATRRELERSELFTPFQIATLLDHRSRTGDILSFAELSSLAGFAPSFVALLKPFISIATYVDIAGKHSQLRASDIKNEATVRLTATHKGPSSSSSQPSQVHEAAAKYRLTASDRISAALGYKGRIAEQQLASGHISYTDIRRRYTLTLGDFNARFGQGLCLWSGFAMNSSSSFSSLIKRPSGIRPYSSYSGEYALRGGSVEMNFGNFYLSTLAAVKSGKEGVEVMPAMNLRYAGMKVDGGVTAKVEAGEWAASADVRSCVKGVDLFSELAYRSKDGVAWCGGVSSAVGDGFKVGTVAKVDEAYSLVSLVEGLFGRRMHSVVGSVDLAYYPEPPYGSDEPGVQVKALLNYKAKVGDLWSFGTRANARLRSYDMPKEAVLGMNCKLGLRAEAARDDGSWLAKARVESIIYKGVALAGYFEGGYRTECFGTYMKAGLYRVDNWDDRIYAYERDAPGNFTNLALYGRGGWFSVYMSYKLLRNPRQKFHLKFLMVSQPVKVSVRFQYSISF